MKYEGWHAEKYQKYMGKIDNAPEKIKLDIVEKLYRLVGSILDDCPVDFLVSKKKTHEGKKEVFVAISKKAIDLGNKYSDGEELTIDPEQYNIFKLKDFQINFSDDSRDYWEYEVNVLFENLEREIYTKGCSGQLREEIDIAMYAWLFSDDAEKMSELPFMILEKRKMASPKTGKNIIPNYLCAYFDAVNSGKKSPAQWALKNCSKDQTNIKEVLTYQKKKHFKNEEQWQRLLKDIRKNKDNKDYRNHFSDFSKFYPFLTALDMHDMILKTLGQDREITLSDEEMQEKMKELFIDNFKLMGIRR